MRQDDRGIALLSVIGLAAVLLIVIASGMTIAVSGLKQADTQQDQNGALDAAYAGVQDYLARINLNSNYVRYGDASSAFSAGSSLTALGTNAAFTTTAGGSWSTVPGSGGASSFRYEVNNTSYASSGVLRLRSTGRVGDTTRSIVASFRVRGFIDYTYFTDYEIQDPQISGEPTSCIVHAWEGRATSCRNIQFGPYDSLNGRVHSNDTMLICGAKFTGSVTTAYQTSPYYTDSSCPGTNNPAPVVAPAAELPMPATNTSMRSDAKCLYTGPTRITYNDDATATTPGTMTVVSPWTRSVSDASACGSISDLRSTTGAKVKQLDADLLYVQNVPATASDPNYWSASQVPTGLTCLDASGAATSNGTGAGWSLTTGGTTIRYPLAGEDPAVNWRTGSQWTTATPAYGCRNGDLYVQGKVSVATTAASENYVYITDDLTYADRTADVLGLVGQNAVLVWNPMNNMQLTTSGTTVLGYGTPMKSGTDREIDAAILSVAHTFQVQNYTVNPNRGTLTVFGSIAQKFRGPVALSTGGGNYFSGYAKSYSYDPLLAVVSPPKFLSPSAISFTLQRYASVPAAYSPTGAPSP